MANRPPVFRAPGWREPEPWARGRFHKDKRKRGRAGQRERAEILAEEPFCRTCLEADPPRHVAPDVVDHKIPLSWGGSDDRGNKQALCNPCHDAKSKRERAIDARHRRKT